MRLSVKVLSSWKFEGHTEDVLKPLSGPPGTAVSDGESTAVFHEFLHKGRERLRNSHAGHMKAFLRPTTRVAARGPGGGSDRAGVRV